MRYPVPTLPEDFDIDAVVGFRVEDGVALIRWSGEEFRIVSTEMKYTDEDDFGYRHYRHYSRRYVPPRSVKFELMPYFPPKPKPPPPKRTTSSALGLRRPK